MREVPRQGIFHVRPAHRDLEECSACFHTNMNAANFRSEFFNSYNGCDAMSSNKTHNVNLLSQCEAVLIAKN